MPGKFIPASEAVREKLDWGSLARGHGVPAASVGTPEQFVREVQRGFASGGPYLIEALV